MEATPLKETSSPKAEVSASSPSRSTRMIDVREMYADTERPEEQEGNGFSAYPCLGRSRKTISLIAGVRLRGVPRGPLRVIIETPRTNRA